MRDYIRSICFIRKLGLRSSSCWKTKSINKGERVGTEKITLEHYFPGCVKWIDPTGDTKVEMTLKTNNHNKYTFQLYIQNFPSAVPDIVVSSPKPMPKWEGTFGNHLFLIINIPARHWLRR